jgi:hypothetical protein
MMINFSNIHDHTIPLKEFYLKWRFTDENFDAFPEHHLNLLKPLDKEASNFLSHFINDANLHEQFPFKYDFFRVIDKVDILNGNKPEIKKWLYQRGLPFKKSVYLSWEPNLAMIVPWKSLIKYYDSFYYESSDDLTVIDDSLNWALLFHHEGVIYFGTNQRFVPGESFSEIDCP